MAMVVFIMAIIAILVFASHLVVRARHDPQEPPVVTAPIPFIGHLINLIRHGSHYYSILAYVLKPPKKKRNKKGRLPYRQATGAQKLILTWCMYRHKHNLSIYTIHMPGTKIYVATDPEILAVIDRKAKPVSFAPLVVTFARQMMLPTKHALDKLTENLDQKQGTVGVRPETVRSMHITTAGTKGLQQLSSVAIAGVIEALNRVDNDHVVTAACKERGLPPGTHGQRDEAIPLFAWTRQMATEAISDAVYGPLNPLRDRQVAEAFWYVQDNMVPLGINIAPSWIAPRAHRARSVFFEGMRKYYENGGLQEASDLVKDRYRVNTKYGISQRDIERFELSVCIAMLINTAGGLGWICAEACSRPNLVHTIRAEIKDAVSYDSSSGVSNLNLAKIVHGSKVLLPFFHEVLRVRSASISVRVVLEDTKINDGTLLKKDALVFLPSGVIHGNEEAWGPDAKSVRPERLLLKTNTKSCAESSLKEPAAEQFVPSRPPPALRTFGRGAVRCPGQYFTENVALSTVVMLLAKYDLEPASADGWKFPALKSNVLASVLPPDGDIPLRFKPRSLDPDTKWNFTWEPLEPEKPSS